MGQDEGVDQDLGLLIADLQALHRREGMGKPEFPPQGVETPAFYFGVGWRRLAALVGQPRRLSPHDSLPFSLSISEAGLRL